MKLFPSATWLGASLVAVIVGGCVFDQGGVGAAGDRDAATNDGGNTDGRAVADGGDDIDAGGATDARLVADASGAVDARANDDATPSDAGICVTECVSSTQLRDCTQGGSIIDCPLGCGGGTIDPHCQEIVPSNGATAADLAGVSSGLTLAANEVGVINTDTGEITIDGSPVRAAGAGLVGGIGYRKVSATIAVVAVKSLTMHPASYLRPSGARALILLSEGDVSITAALIDIAGGCRGTDQVTCGGPGGGAGAGGTLLGAAAGCGPGGNGTGGPSGPESGGGGGAMGVSGGDGGDGNGSGTRPGGAGGVTTICPGASLVPLAGGSGGGRGGGTSQIGGAGGGGAGALQITSFTRIILASASSVGAVIWAGGAGGAGTDANGGGGGGSGGAILLEAPAIEVTASNLAANGGGGGDGKSGANGKFGTIDTTPAAGGTGDKPGGAGGARNSAAQPGTGPTDDAGGGGAGVGRIRLNVPAAALTLSGETISPAHTRADPAVQ